MWQDMKETESGGTVTDLWHLMLVCDEIETGFMTKSVLPYGERKILFDISKIISKVVKKS